MHVGRAQFTLGVTNYTTVSSSGPSDTTIRRLFAVSMNRCAFPACETPIIDSTSKTILAEVCHIHARNERGPRYNPTQTDEERHGFDNLILMCGVHHKLIDSAENIQRFSPSFLFALKAEHEQQARTNPCPVIQLSDEQLSSLQLAATAYAQGSTHNDFRHAVFRVGGEGGNWGGGGGGGGILTIVGTTRIPAEISLGGQDGNAPGAGGGGGGSVQYIGRPVDSDDVAGGLRLCSLLLANAVSFSGALLNVLGGAWTYVVVPSIPSSIRIWFALSVDCGDVEPATLLRLLIQVATPSRKVVLECTIDIEVPDCHDLVKRASRAQLLELDVTEYGRWMISVRSSSHEMGSHYFEIRAT